MQIASFPPSFPPKGWLGSRPENPSLKSNCAAKRSEGGCPKVHSRSRCQVSSQRGVVMASFRPPNARLQRCAAFFARRLQLPRLARPFFNPHETGTVSSRRRLRCTVSGTHAEQSQWRMRSIRIPCGHLVSAFAGVVTGGGGDTGAADPDEHALPLWWPGPDVPYCLPVSGA